MVLELWVCWWAYRHPKKEMVGIPNQMLKLAKTDGASIGLSTCRLSYQMMNGKEEVTLACQPIYSLLIIVKTDRDANLPHLKQQTQPC